MKRILEEKVTGLGFFCKRNEIEKVFWHRLAV